VTAGGEEMTQEVEAAAGLAVHGGGRVPEAAGGRAELVAEGAPARLASKDPTLWGEAAEPEASIRLGWLDTMRRSRDLLPVLAQLRRDIADLDHVVLAGMGGSSLAPEVITRTLGTPLTVLDTTDPSQVRAALATKLEHTVVVVSSKSGSTVETDCHRRAYWQAFTDAGVPDPGRHFVIVTDPGSPLEATGREMGAHVILADPEVGGRYSALTAFGLVPSALAGVAVAELLDQADEFARSLARDTDNPALALGSTLGAAAAAGRDKLVLVDDGTGITGLGDWAEQLLAESTGKDGRGILPVVVEDPSAPGVSGADVLTVTVGGALPPASVPGSGVEPHLSVNGPLGAQFLCWEAATAFAGRLLGINPFDQPDVEEAKHIARQQLGGGPAAGKRSTVDDVIELHGTSASTCEEALRELVAGVDPRGYLAVLAFLDRFGDREAARLRPALARVSSRPVTFGWGPRYLHSTGQLHKGGPPVGSFLQLTGAVVDDLEVPGRPYTFGQLQAAQAAGDRQVLLCRGRPVLRLHLLDRPAGVAQLLDVLRRWEA
jgi:glucose-6-phosphate isomerase